MWCPEGQWGLQLLVGKLLLCNEMLSGGSNRQRHLVKLIRTCAAMHEKNLNGCIKFMGEPIAPKNRVFLRLALYYRQPLSLRLPLRFVIFIRACGPYFLVLRPSCLQSASAHLRHRSHNHTSMASECAGHCHVSVALAFMSFLSNVRSHRVIREILSTGGDHREE